MYSRVHMPERNFDASTVPPIYLTEGDRPNETEHVHTVRLCRILRYFLPEQTLQAHTLQQTFNYEVGIGEKYRRTWEKLL